MTPTTTSHPKRQPRGARHLCSALVFGLLTACAGFSAQAQISVGISIGIDMPVYPQLVRVPGYPVYYDPQAASNYFFYDGLYWVYTNDNWYQSTWYNGPWQVMAPEVVPLYVLRIPVRYYRQPPPYFSGWRGDAPPRWGEHWGTAWQQRRRGWDQWDHRSAPPAAPLPVYQQKFPGDRYPRAPERQEALRAENYRFQPKEAVARQHWQQQDQRGGQAEAPRQQRPATSQQQEPQRQYQPPQAQQQNAQPARQAEPQERGRDNRPPAREQRQDPREQREPEKRGEPR